jgi:hypothetical protein
MFQMKTRSILAGGAAALFSLSLITGAAQASDHKRSTVNPVGNWKLVGLQIDNQPVVPCPTPPTAFSERWFCEADTRLVLRKNGTYRDNIPIIQTNRGTWFSNGKNIIVFDDADDDGSDARAYKMTVSGNKGQNMKISLRSAARGADRQPVELHMIFRKQ